MLEFGCIEVGVGGSEWKRVGGAAAAQEDMEPFFSGSNMCVEGGRDCEGSERRSGLLNDETWDICRF